MGERPQQFGRKSPRLGLALVALLTLAACSGGSDPTTTAGPPPTSTSTTSTSTTEPASGSTTTTAAPIDTSTQPFSIAVGSAGVTYDLDGAPPSGPSSFAVLDDGSVVIADTMAATRGEPRLLHYDRSGELQATIDLAGEEVASIVDVVSDGSSLAILDVFIAMGRYRVLTLSRDGEVTEIFDIPPGFHFEDSLTGLAWDDAGILLEFELGGWYARVTETGAIESPVDAIFEGVSIELSPGEGRTTEVVTDSATFSIERATDLGGATLIGIAPDGSIVVVVDEVDLSGPAFVVTRRVQRYSESGEFETEQVIDAGDQFLDIPRPLELDAAGTILYLQALPDRMAIAVLR